MERMENMKIWRGIVLLALLLLVLTVPALAVAPEDFACKGVQLGGPSDGMAKALGEPLFDNERMVYGIHVKYYTFQHDIVVGVDPNNGKVVDIVIKDHDYRAPGDVRYGATAYWVQHVYGKKARVFMDGATWYIYENPAQKGDRLLIEAEPTTGTLLSWRITSLPLTDEEADQRESSTEWANRELNAILMDQRDIDTSAVDGSKNEKSAKDGK